MKIVVVTGPLSSVAGKRNTDKLLRIVEPLAKKIFVISGNFATPMNCTVFNIKGISPNDKLLIKIFKIIIIQLYMSFFLIKIRKETDTIVSFLGTIYFFPTFIGRILRKKTIVITSGSASKNVIIKYPKFGKIYGGIFRILERFNYALSDQIIVDINVESENLIREFGLAKYRDKISFGGAAPVDVNSFRINKKLKDRKNIIGYIGRHSPEKGVMNFAKAIPLILKERNDLEFIIGSGGPLFEKVKEELKENGSYDKVTFTGWVPREKLPDYFNEMKLIVVPSYTETIPNVIMEAMACGTPIVASPVDAIPDLINDRENGFLMEDNSPECIAKNIIRALANPRLDKIVKNAHDLIQGEYTYEAVVENYRKLLMGKGKNR